MPKFTFLGNENNQAQSEFLKKEIDDMSALEKFGASAGGSLHGAGLAVQQGVRRLGREIGLLNDSDVEKIDREAKEHQESMEPLLDTTAGAVGDFTGDVIAAAPTMAIPGGAAARFLPRATSNALQGGAASLLDPVTEGDFVTEKAKQFGVGSAFGAGGSEALRAGSSAIGKGYHAIKDRATDKLDNTADSIVRGVSEANQQAVQQVQAQTSQALEANQEAVKQMQSQITEALASQGVDFNRLGKDVKESMIAQAMDAVKSGSPVDGKQLAVKADFAEIGATPTLGQLTGDFEQLQREANLARIGQVGEPIRARRADTNQKIKGFAEKTRDLTGGRDNDLFGAGSANFDAINAKFNLMQEDITNLYKVAETRFGDKQVVTPEKLYSFIKENQFQGPIARAFPIANKYLTDRGVVKEAKLLNGSTVAYFDRNLNVKEAETLRKILSEASNSETRGDGRKLMWEMVEALDDDVENGLGFDAFKNGRDLARQRFTEIFGDQKGRRVDPIARQIVEEKIRKEDIYVSVIKNSGIDQLKQYKRAVLTSPNGKQAWDDLRYQTFQWLIDQALKSGGKDAAGQTIWSGQNFKKALAQLQKNKKLNIIFDKESEIARLGTLSRVGEITIPMEGQVNFSGTAGSLVSTVMDFLEKIPRLGRPISYFKNLNKMAEKGKALRESEVNTQNALNPDGFIKNEAQQKIALNKKTKRKNRNSKISKNVRENLSRIPVPQGFAALFDED